MELLTVLVQVIVGIWLIALVMGLLTRAADIGEDVKQRLERSDEASKAIATGAVAVVVLVLCLFGHFVVTHL